MTEDLRQLGDKLLGKTSGNMKQGKETWWWNENVQESIQTKKLAKITLDKDTNEENKAAYKTANKEANKSVAIAKARAYDRLYADMEVVYRELIITIFRMPIYPMLNKANDPEYWLLIGRESGQVSHEY